MSKPLLKWLPSSSRFEKTYQVHGFEHLVVEAEFEDGEGRRNLRIMYWVIRDTTFSVFDKWRRWQVLIVPTLDVARSWLRAGGASLWDPEKRKINRDWKPIPNGWSIEEARSEVPCRTASGDGNGERLGAERRRDREVRREDSRADRRRDCDPGEPVDRKELKQKRFAVCPDYVHSDDGNRHWISFGALTWLYGVDPSECIEVDDRWEKGHRREDHEHLIWLHPQRDGTEYNKMKQELAKGEDAFKLVEP